MSGQRDPAKKVRMIWYKRKHVLLLKSYLTKRSKFISFGGYQSNLENIDAGVPKGSVLGPLLLKVYINDLQNITSLKVLNFADDILLYTTFKKTHI